MLFALEYLTKHTSNLEIAQAGAQAAGARVADLETRLKRQADRTSQLEEGIRSIENTITWRTRNSLLRIPYLGTFVRRAARVVFGRGSR
jgi:hypothetical protein